MAEQVTKNQHYVPRRYLQRFTNERGRFFVFDKKLQKTWVTAPENVAKADFFYDFPIDGLEINGAPVVDPQLVEHTLAKVEAGLGKQFDEFLEAVEGGKISSRHILAMSYVIFLQMSRTLEFRTQMRELSEKYVLAMAQAELDRKFPDQELKAVMEATDDFWTREHAAFMFNPVVAGEVLQVFYNHIWIVGRNDTSIPLYTSDHPVVMHVPKQLRELGVGTGITSPCVQICFPLTPQYVVLLLDRTAYTDALLSENLVVPLDEEEIIFLNDLQVMTSTRQVFCSEDAFQLAKRRCKESPRICQPERERWIGARMA